MRFLPDDYAPRFSQKKNTKSKFNSSHKFSPHHQSQIIFHFTKTINQKPHIHPQFPTTVSNHFPSKPPGLPICLPLVARKLRLFRIRQCERSFPAAGEGTDDSQVNRSIFAMGSKKIAVRGRPLFNGFTGILGLVSKQGLDHRNAFTSRALRRLSFFL